MKQLADSFLDKDGNKTAQSESARVLLQSLLACGGAAASGNDCGSGALGAAGAVGLNNLLDALLKTDPDKMTAEEKLNRENLIGSIVAGIAEGTGNNANDVLTGANTEMENNYLSQKQVYQLIDELKQCGKDTACAEEKNKKYLGISEKQEKELNATCGVDRSSSACTKLIIDAIGGGNASQTTRHNGTGFGLGLTYAVTEHIEAGFEAQYIQYNKKHAAQSDGKPNTTEHGVNVKCRF